MGKKKSQKEEKRYKLHVNSAQVEHLRDLLGILINHATNLTVSEHLAKHNKRSPDERELWDLVVELCERAKVPCGDDAPDYVVAVGPPEVGILRIDPESEESEEEQEDGDGQSTNKCLFTVDEE